MAVVLKTTEPVRVPGVRIPLSPPSFAKLVSLGPSRTYGRKLKSCATSTTGRTKVPRYEYYVYERARNHSYVRTKPTRNSTRGSQPRPRSFDESSPLKGIPSGLLRSNSSSPG